MSADEAIRFITDTDAALARRQRRLARLYCANGHDWRIGGDSAHMGSWDTCRRCCLIRDAELPRRKRRHLRVVR